MSTPLFNNNAASACSKNDEYESKKILFSKCGVLCKEIVSKYRFLHDETIKHLGVINIDETKEMTNF